MEGKTVAESSDTIIAYDNELLNKIGGTNVLFNDSRILFLGPEQLERFGITARQKTDAPVEDEGKAMPTERQLTSQAKITGVVRDEQGEPVRC